MNDIQKLIKLIDESVEGFNKRIPLVQQQIFNEIIDLTKSLDTKGGNIAQSAKNIRLIGEIKRRIEKIILTPSYNEQIQKFTEIFPQVQKIQNNYFSSVVKQYKPPKTLEAIRNESVNSVIESLTTGTKAEIIEPVREILRTNITSGAKYSDMVNSLKDFLTDTKAGDGKLVKHVKQITTDSLNQFSRTNTKLITDDLGLSWFSYNGAIIEGSRDFCLAMHRKKYFHVSEIPKLLKGDFKEFRDIKGKINPRNGLPYGMIDGTNELNFLVNLGGYSCGHQAIPVAENVVPQSLRDSI